MCNHDRDRLGSFATGLLAAGLLLAIGGCGEARRMKTQTELFSGSNPPKEMHHVSVVADPLAAAQPESATGGLSKAASSTQPVKVLRGGPPGPNNTTAANKCSFIKGDGFFTMPASGDARLDLFVAVRGQRDLKIEVLAKAPAGKTVYNVTLPAESSWQEVVVPLPPPAFKPGSVINDITVFQIGQGSQGSQGQPAELYVRSVSLRTY